MTREVELVSYLPPFMAEYKEINAALEAENPEFMLIWKAAEQVLNNEFIATADEYGIARFEEILHIFPSKDDTVESRRARIQMKWFVFLPYTWRMLIQRLTALCKSNDFQVYIPSGTWYELRIRLPIEPHTESILQEIQQMLEEFLPANLLYYVTGVRRRKAQSKIFIGCIRNIYVKIVAEPEKKNSHIYASVYKRIGIGAVSYVRLSVPVKKEQL